jgi:hypothetical protein
MSMKQFEPLFQLLAVSAPPSLSPFVKLRVRIEAQGEFHPEPNELSKP